MRGQSLDVPSCQGLAEASLGFGLDSKGNREPSNVLSKTFGCWIKPGSGGARE